MTRRLLGLAVLVLVFLRDDFWLPDSGSRILGLPGALAYQVGLCLAASVVMWVFVRFAWPADDGEDGE